MPASVPLVPAPPTEVPVLLVPAPPPEVPVPLVPAPPPKVPVPLVPAPRPRFQFAQLLLCPPEISVSPVTVLVPLDPLTKKDPAPVLDPMDPDPVSPDPVSPAPHPPVHDTASLASVPVPKEVPDYQSITPPPLIKGKKGLEWDPLGFSLMTP